MPTAVRIVQTARMGDVMFHDYLIVPRQVMVEIGAPVQTLAAVMRLANDESFHTNKARSEMAMLPVGTTRRHLKELVDHGLLLGLGRKEYQDGKKRRTVSYQIPKRTRKLKQHHARLPRWACLGSTWSERAILALLISRETLDDGRRHCTRKSLERDGGLSPRSVERAAESLCDRGFVTFDEDFLDLDLDANVKLPLEVDGAARIYFDWSQTAFGAHKIARITNPRTQADRRLILAVCYLQRQTGYSESWFFDALEGIRLAAEDGRLKGRPIAYWRSILKSEVPSKRDFDKDVTAVKIPGEYLQNEFWKTP